MLSVSVKQMRGMMTADMLFVRMDWGYRMSVKVMHCRRTTSNRTSCRLPSDRKNAS